MNMFLTKVLRTVVFICLLLVMFIPFNFVISPYSLIQILAGENRERILAFRVLDWVEKFILSIRVKKCKF